jgi:hypothetical protein
MGLFSRRNDVIKERYTHDIPQLIRHRILHILRQHSDGNQQFSFEVLGIEILPKLLIAYGGLYKRQNPPQYYDALEWIEHAESCSHEQFMDLLQLCFECECLGRASRYTKLAVEKINRVFEEEGIGFEMTMPSVEVIEIPKHFNERGLSVPKMIEYRNWQLSKPLKKTERTVHEVTVKPVLQHLAVPQFAAANNELHASFNHMKRGDYADAITSCCSCFESVLKTICKEKGWAYNEIDTCSKLVKVCNQNGLIFSFYVPMLEGIGSIRNKLGGAHGKGSTPEYPSTTRDQAEHMIAVTCSHIAFIIKQSKI